MFGEAIRGEGERQPDFDTAVDLHRLVEAMRNASDTGRAVASRRSAPGVAPPA